MRALFVKDAQGNVKMRRLPFFKIGKILRQPRTGSGTGSKTSWLIDRSNILSPTGRFCRSWHITPFGAYSPGSTSGRKSDPETKLVNAQISQESQGIPDTRAAKSAEVVEQNLR
jgi:hypothetical protein